MGCESVPPRNVRDDSHEVSITQLLKHNLEKDGKDVTNYRAEVDGGGGFVRLQSETKNYRQLRNADGGGGGE